MVSNQIEMERLELSERNLRPKKVFSSFKDRRRNTLGKDSSWRVENSPATRRRHDDAAPWRHRRRSTDEANC